MEITPVTPDLETISLDELRKLADAEALKQSTKPVDDAPPVDDKPPVDDAPPVDDKAPKVFVAERTVDLGDGAGVQVFKGKGGTREEALEELSDKLTDAQKNATKKIRELSKAKPIEDVVSKEDESLYSAELMSAPTVAFKKLFKQVTGIDVEKFKTVTAREEAFQAGQERKSIGDQFVINHPDFLDNNRNAQRLKKAVALQGDFTLENLEKAYQDLNESGLLEVKGEEASAEQKKAEAEAKRIADAAEAQSSLRTRKASGLSTQHRPAVQPSTTLSEDEMYSLPLEEVRKRANQQLASNR